jgi:hypothetical protein
MKETKKNFFAGTLNKAKDNVLFSNIRLFLRMKKKDETSEDV